MTAQEVCRLGGHLTEIRGLVGHDFAIFLNLDRKQNCIINAVLLSQQASRSVTCETSSASGRNVLLLQRDTMNGW